MSKALSLLWLLVIALSSSACLRKETNHILYLSPDGGVRWVATEVNVYSDEEDAGARQREEQTYIGPALLGIHLVAEGLRVLGPDSLVDTLVVRDERPFHVVTQARFADIERLSQRMIRELGVAATTRLVREDTNTTLHLVIDFNRQLQETESPFLKLAEDADSIRIILAEGRFAPSPGFTVQDGIVASLSDEWIAQAQEAYEHGGAVDLKLSWTTR